MMNKAFYTYLFLDLAFSIRSFRAYRANSQLHSNVKARSAVFCTLRIVVTSESLSYYQMHHMRTVCTPILSKQTHDSEKQTLMNKIDGFQ